VHAAIREHDQKEPLVFLNYTQAFL